MKFGIISDIHVGTENEHKGVVRKLSRHSLDLLEIVIETMNSEVQPSFVVNLGDAINDRSHDIDVSNYKDVLRRLSRLSCPVYHVIGNHEQRGIEEGELLRLTRRDRLYYSFDCAEYHGVVLFSRDPERVEITIDDEQSAWVEQDLSRTDKRTIVFVHHLLADQDLAGNFWFDGNPKRFLIENRTKIRRLIEKSGKVTAVFNGHAHWNKMNVHNGIPYFTIQSLVENFKNDDVPSGCFAIGDVSENSIDVNIVGQDKELFHYDFVSK